MVQEMLALFGDIATELLIEYDGDEGLFKAYESIEFMAPVYAGDFIEARGKIIKYGNTSRTMTFEAKKSYHQDLILMILLRIFCKRPLLFAKL